MAVNVIQSAVTNNVCLLNVGLNMYFTRYNGYETFRRGKYLEVFL